MQRHKALIGDFPSCYDVSRIQKERTSASAALGHVLHREGAGEDSESTAKPHPPAIPFKFGILANHPLKLCYPGGEPR